MTLSRHTQVEVSCGKSCPLTSAWGRKASEEEGRRGSDQKRVGKAERGLMWYDFVLFFCQSNSTLGVWPFWSVILWVTRVIDQPLRNYHRVEATRGWSCRCPHQPHSGCLPCEAKHTPPGVGVRSPSRAVSSLVCLWSLLAMTLIVRKRYGFSFY